MIRTKQQSSISKIWRNLNQSWGVAIGFLMLLFVIPLAIIVADPSKQNLTNSNADSSKPIVVISPQQGQGLKGQFVAEIRDTDVTHVETADIWFGVLPPDVSRAPGNYATISLKNYTLGSGFDWRAVVYKRSDTGSVLNLTTLKPDENVNSNLSKIYATPSSKNGEISLSTIDSPQATSVIKYKKVEKVGDSTLKFYFDIEFRSKFSDKNLSMYMKAQRGIAYGSTTSSIGNNEWTNVGSWIVADASARPSVAQNGVPKFTTVARTSVKAGQSYTYEIGAIDPENDPLKYQAYTTLPSFLKLTGHTLSGTPAVGDVGSYTITLLVSDSTGNTVTQTFSLVVSNAVQTTPAPTLAITSPKANDTLKGKTNNVAWTLSSQSGVANTRVSYAQFGSTSFKILSTVASTVLSYTWDSSSLSSGKYILRVEALDSNGAVVSAATTDSFNVDNSVDDSTIQPPRISGRTPEEGVITDTLPTIAATINAGSADPDLTTLVVTLDGNDITSKITKGVNSFSYTPVTALSYGNHEVKIVVKGKDATGSKGILNEVWSFTIDNKLAGTDNKSSTVVTNKIKLPVIGIEVDQWLGTLIIGTFVILLFAILIFSIIALIRTLKGKDDDMTQITKYYQQENNPTPVDPTNLGLTGGAMAATPEIKDPFESSYSSQQYTEPESQNYSQPVASSFEQPVQNPFADNSAPVDTSVFSQPAEVNSQPIEVSPIASEPTASAYSNLETPSTVNTMDYSSPAVSSYADTETPSSVNSLENNLEPVTMANEPVYDLNSPQMLDENPTFTNQDNTFTNTMPSGPDVTVTTQNAGPANPTSGTMNSNEPYDPFKG